MTATLPRITARVDENTQRLLAKATALTGMTSINAFVLSSAVEKAKAIIEREQSLQLSENDAILLMQALEQPPKVHQRLKTASQNYQQKQQ